MDQSVSLADKSARKAGFTDARCRTEFWIAALASLLFSVSTCHSALVAIAFQRTGYDLRAIGVLIGITAIPVLASSICSGLVIARFGALATLRVAMFLLAL